MAIHQPVLVKEVVQLLNCQPGKVIMDGTAGSGGHSLEILKKILPEGYLIGLDVDAAALERTGERLKNFEGHFTLFRENYKNLARIMEKENLRTLDGVLLDLGLSSEQLEEAGRGFSFLKEGPLDMRYDLRQRVTAEEVINTESQKNLAFIFQQYGEERKAHRLARIMVERRKIKSIKSTLELSRIAAGAKAYSAKEKINPATRIFQALRIYINQELENLKLALNEAIRAISSGGRLVVISYHSLEDRIVKNFFREQARLGKVRIITLHPLVPSLEEIRENRRSRSAKLRTAEII